MREAGLAQVHVCAVTRIEEVVAASGARSLVSLLREHYDLSRPAAIVPERHLRLSFNDIAEPRDGLRLAQAEDVERLLGFVRGWDRQAPLLIHCFAGVSRSTAAAFVTACALRADVSEADWAQRLRAASPTATPNPHLVTLADSLLGREGRMVAAIAAIGRGAECHSGTPFHLDLTAPA